ncbi:5-oxoprolinase (ATP-hydrolysing) [Podila verticillata NRRL 6337]|nr:5-oxoprolinase (ATP-hydrolysing) [Podila verticillata NRRL 6337]
MDSELLPTGLFPTYLFPPFFPQFTPPLFSASLNCPFLPFQPHFFLLHLFTLMSLSTNHKQGIRVCIDRGGTFTDCVASIPVPVSQEHPTGRKELVVKLLSVDPSNYPDAPREGIRRILEIATGEPHPRDTPVATHNLESIRMGTTVATNALLERKGERCALLITKGFKDLLLIGNQSRPKIFDLSITKPDVLYQTVVEVEERVTLVGYTSSPMGIVENIDLNDPSYIKGISGEYVHVLQRPDLAKIKGQLQELYQEGYRSIAVCLLHSYTFVDHEQAVGQLAQEIGFTHISLSSAIMPMIKMVPRGTSATADAYLTPCIKTYVDGFVSGFDKNLTKNVSLQFMQSDGGLVPVSHFSGLRAILSGPAGGVVGYGMTAFDPKDGVPVIGFDMGGTSTDVSRFNGKYEHVFETTTAGVTVQAPQLDINTVAAGGGSMLFFRNGTFVVGPESASAHPGPACYRKGGPLTVTDANLVLGRLNPEYFPKIFGPKENESLDINIARSKFETLTKEINEYMAKDKESDGLQWTPMSVDEVAYGFIKVANESMCRPIRALTEAKGHDASKHILSVFGGAGGQHACAIARALGISNIFIHKYASVLSAYGLSLADVVYEAQEPSSETLSKKALPLLQERINTLVSQCQQELGKQGFENENIDFEIYLNLRYNGTDCALMTLKPEDKDDWDFAEAFVRNYKYEFGFSLPDRDIIVDDIRVRGIGKSAQSSKMSVHEEMKTLKPVPVGPSKAEGTTSIYFETGRNDQTPTYLLEKLAVGTTVPGPAIIMDANSAILIQPFCTGLITSNTVVITIGDGHKTEITTEMDPIMLAVFGNRFMSIAEQMGRTLQKTAISTNIKERLDFSCALFGPDGGLVANAPHIPVHLGSLSHAVKYQMEYYKGDITEGDVILTNHPAAGGSHLPDITVITPVFNEGKIVFFVASRGHHADIGGILPGSMPPNSKELYQEGAAIRSFKLVSKGHFDLDGLTKLLVDEPAKYPGCSGTRCLRDNVSDLKAQVAANHKGIGLVKGLISEYGLDVVQAYMMHIRKNAEMAVRDLLKGALRRSEGKALVATDYMDDGSRINLHIEIDPKDGSAIFDFEGTSEEVYGNCNAPTSVTHSAIIYCLRCMVAMDIPLNQGCLSPVTIRIPDKSMLAPSETAAVVGGNVLVSQRLVDVILKAFQVCGASQGCMNNLTFGVGGKSVDTESGETKVVEGWGYYETIAGGAGAGPTWNGQSGVHTHMTNTRITDPEILERRYPVILREFALRAGSGGKGLHPGGEGLIRDIEFLEPMEVSILSERRVFQPYGIHGGGPGQSGKNLWVQKRTQPKVGTVEDEGKVETVFRTVNLSGKNTAHVKAGDRLLICTPGGGAWGSLDGSAPQVAHVGQQAFARGSVNEYQSLQEASV